MAFFKSRRKLILLAAGATVAGVSTYAFHRTKISKFAGTLISLADAISSISDTINIISTDLNNFLLSDSNEIPPTLKQISKISASDEFSGSVSRVLEALTVGISRGIRSVEPIGADNRAGISDRVLNKIFSKSGSGFISVVVGSFARNLVIGFYSKREDLQSGFGWVDLVCEEKCKEIIADSIRVFVGTAVEVFLDKTMHINTYDEFFAGLTNPRHDAKVKELLVSICNSAMETLVRTSHKVLTNPNFLENDRNISFDSVNGENLGWVSQFSSTLADPSNKKFVLDVTGRVTFETVRSVIEFVMLKAYDGIKIGMSSIRQEVSDKSLEIVRYVSAKYVVICTICFVLCLHVFAGTRGLMQR